jgi:hypothetical protein
MIHNSKINTISQNTSTAFYKRILKIWKNRQQLLKVKIKGVAAMWQTGVNLTYENN